MNIVVLGAAAGGGLPQWNCGCPNCRAARATQAQLAATQTSVIVSSDGVNWFMINATPDFRSQALATVQLHPRQGSLRNSPIAGVILTNGEIDAIVGLLSMRERGCFGIFAHPRVLDILSDNSIFNVLNPDRVPRHAIALERSFAPPLPDGSPSGLTVTAFAVPGKSAWFLESNSTSERDHPGDTIGLRIADRSGKLAVIIPGCARIDDGVRARISGADLLLFDGTLWQDDEMILAGLSDKRGQDMGHVSMSGDYGAIANLADTPVAQKVFIHLNNSNPAHSPQSAERQAVEAAGWQIAYDGMEIIL